jgi:hypothetical protein
MVGVHFHLSSVFGKLSQNRDLGYGTFRQVMANYHQSSPSVISYDLGVIFLISERKAATAC